MLDQDCCSGCGGSDKSEESDWSLCVSGGPSISLDALPLAEELRDSFSLSCIIVWLVVAGVELLVLEEWRVPSAAH